MLLSLLLLAIDMFLVMFVVYSCCCVAAAGVIASPGFAPAQQLLETKLDQTFDPQGHRPATLILTCEGVS